MLYVVVDGFFKTNLKYYLREIGILEPVFALSVKYVGPYK